MGLQKPHGVAIGDIALPATSNEIWPSGFRTGPTAATCRTSRPSPCPDVSDKPTIAIGDTPARRSSQRKLMVLDFVLTQPDVAWYATEQDTVALFTDRFRVPLADLPRRVFASRRSSGVRVTRVLTKTPDWSALASVVPAAIRTLLARCLERDRKQRIPEMSTVRFLLDHPLATPATKFSTLEGDATVRLANGSLRRAEIHWYKAHRVGKRGLKVKLGSPFRWRHHRRRRCGTV